MAKKQFELPGVESPKNKAVEDAAEAYVDVRDKRMRLTGQEVEKREVLLDEMRKARLKAYRYDETVVLLTAEEKVKVKKVKDADDGEGDDDTDD